MNKRHIETLTQTITGFIISFIILKCYGMSFSESLSLQMTFLVVSYIRSYLIRSLFAKMEVEGVTEKWEGNETWIEWNCESFISKTKTMLVTLKERIINGDIILKQWVEVEIPHKK